MTGRRRPEVAKTILTRLRKACLVLPEVREEQAWVGTRWCIRKETFAHVLMIADDGRRCTRAPPAPTVPCAC